MDSDQDCMSSSSLSSNGGRYSPAAKRKKSISKKRIKSNVSGGKFGGSTKLNPVIVLDYDLTLVKDDEDFTPFPGAGKFIEDLSKINNSRNVLVLYSHANKAHIEYGLNKFFKREKMMFDYVITDHSIKSNKPVTQVRLKLKSISELVGPFAIIDDMNRNLNEDQYDIVINVRRYTDYKNGTAVSVKYDHMLKLLNEAIGNFYQTKN